jgi:hypothetical protein
MRALFDGSDGPSALLRMPKRIVLFEGVPEGGLEAAQEDLQEDTKRRTRTEKTPPNRNDNGCGIIGVGERCRQ